MEGSRMWKLGDLEIIVIIGIDTYQCAGIYLPIGLVSFVPTTLAVVLTHLLEALALVVSSDDLDIIPVYNEIWRCGVSSRYFYSSPTTTLELS